MQVYASEKAGGFGAAVVGYLPAGELHDSDS